MLMVEETHVYGTQLRLPLKQSSKELIHQLRHSRAGSFRHWWMSRSLRGHWAAGGDRVVWLFEVCGGPSIK